MRDFLRDELEGLPDTIQDAALKQVESAVREIAGRFAIHDDTLTDVTIYRMCGKIYGVMDFLQKLKRELEDQKPA